MSKGLSGTKFEFVFTNVNPSSVCISFKVQNYQKLDFFQSIFFSTVIGVNRSYESSRMVNLKK